MAMNKYGRTTKMTSPPKGMPASMAAKYAALEGKIDKVVTMNRPLIEGGGLSSQGYDPNEMVEIKDNKTGKTTKVPYGSYEHQSSIYFPKEQYAQHYDGIGPGDIGVQKFKGEDLSNYNANPLNRRMSAGLKTEELRTRKGSTVFKSGASEAGMNDNYQEQFEQPIKGVTDLPSRYNKEQAILKDYKKEKDDLAAMDKEWADISKPMPIRPVKRELPKLQGKKMDIPEETTWKNPETTELKTKKTIIKSATIDNDAPKGYGLKGKGSTGVDLHIFTKKIGPSKGYGIQRGTEVVSEQVPKGRYNREEKMAKAFYAPESAVRNAGYSSRTDDFLKEEGGAMVQQYAPKVIKSDIKNIKSEKKQYIAEKTKGGKAIDATTAEGISEYNKSIKQARLASRYAKKADISVSGDGTWKAGDKSKIKYFTPDYEKEGGGKKGAMFGYSDAGKQERSRMTNLQMEQKYEVYPHSKTAEQNVVNRNSTTERMKKFWGY